MERTFASITLKEENVAVGLVCVAMRASGASCCTVAYSHTHTHTPGGVSMFIHASNLLSTHGPHNIQTYAHTLFTAFQCCVSVHLLSMCCSKP